MQPTEHACDSQRIEDYLSDQLTKAAQADFEQHLSGCDACRQELQGRAAEPEMWSDAVCLLGQSSTAEPHDEHHDADSDGQSRRALSVLDSLNPTDDPEMLGRIGEYEISGVVGVGGMGAVLKGFDKSLRRVVAIKVMAPHLAGSGSARTRFQREARAAAAITHDNVIDIYSVSEANGLPYLVMPYARGPSLQKRIDDGGPLSAIQVVRIARQIASGLAAAHEQGLVHRDIKPANILLSEGIERLWITDFGVARAMDDASMTQTGVIAGTPQYMSPEQARGESVDPRSDLFSLGSILYTACTGRPPFRSEAAYGILRRITDSDPRPIREINPDIPLWLCHFIDRLMAKHPADRFETAEEVAEVLDTCLAHLQQPTQIELPSCVVVPMQAQAASRLQTNDSQMRGAVPRAAKIPRTGVWLMVATLLTASLSVLALQMTAPADISGNWAGEDWQQVSLSSVAEAADWYTGTLTDQDGRQGALQLEWSRVQRRYNGRWKMGDGHSGSITLRVGDAGEVRGAVSVDADSTTESADARLREFRWRRSSEPIAETAAAPSVWKREGTPQSIESPIKGVIVRWGDGIVENARVTKGQFICEIQGADSGYKARLKDQWAASESRVEATETVLEVTKRNLEAATVIVASQESQLNSYVAVKEQIVAGADADIASAKNKVEAERAQLEEYEAALIFTSADYDRAKGLAEQSLLSDLKLQQAEQKFKEAEAKVKKLQAYVRAAENDVVSKQSDRNAKEQRAQVDVNYSMSLLAKAKKDVSTAEADIAKAQADLAKAKKELIEMQTKLAQQQTQLIRSPFDGFVTELANNNSSAMLKEGDPICRVWPENAEPATSAAVVPSQPVPPQPEPTPFVGNSLPGFSAAGLNTAETIAANFGPASDLARRLRDSRARVAGRKKDIERWEPKQSHIVAQRQAIEERMTDAASNTADDNANGDPQKSASEATMNGLRSQLNDLINLQQAMEKQSPARRIALDSAQRQLAETEAELDTILKLLNAQIQAAETRVATQIKLRDMTQRGFDVGDGDLYDVLRVTQSTDDAAAELQQLRLLLDYNKQLGGDAETEAATD